MGVCLVIVRTQSLPKKMIFPVIYCFPFWNHSAYCTQCRVSSALMLLVG